MLPVDVMRQIRRLQLRARRAVQTLLGDIEVAVAGTDNYVKVYKGRDVALASGPEYRKVFEAFEAAVTSLTPAPWFRSGTTPRLS